MDDVSLIKAKWKTRIKQSALNEAINNFFDCHEHIKIECDCEQEDKIDDLHYLEDLVVQRFLELDEHMLNGGVWDGDISADTVGSKEYSKINTLILLHKTAHDNNDHETALGADIEIAYAVCDLAIALQCNSIPEVWSNHEV